MYCALKFLRGKGWGDGSVDKAFAVPMRELEFGSKRPGGQDKLVSETSQIHGLWVQEETLLQ